MYVLMHKYVLYVYCNVCTYTQVIVNDVHVRYEDPSAGISPFSLGLMVSSISVQSTDENWVSTVSIELEYFVGENLREFPKLMRDVHLCIMHTHTHIHTHTYTHTHTHTHARQRKEFRSGCDRDHKLMDVLDFSLYWDTQLVGQLEGDDLVVGDITMTSL